MGRAAGHTSMHDHINLAPKYVNDILSDRNVVRTYSDKFPNRIQHDLGDIRIITEDNIVITVIHKGS